MDTIEECSGGEEQDRDVRERGEERKSGEQTPPTSVVEEAGETRTKV